MAARASKSKKGSGASSASKQQPEPVLCREDPVFFIDKCLGLRIVPEALRAIGAKVELKTDHFPEDTKDTDWLPVVGSRRWIILSKDKNLRHNQLEIIGLLQANTHSFLLTTGSMTGPEMAAAFVAAMPDMLGIIASISPPVVGSVSKAGAVRVLFTGDELMDRASEPKS